MWKFISFPRIAGGASRHNIFPRRFTATALRQYVINGKGRCVLLDQAILTLKRISPKDVVPGKPNSLVALVFSEESQYLRKGKGIVDSHDSSVGVLCNHFGPASKEENHRLLPTDDSHWEVGGVQD